MCDRDRLIELLHKAEDICENTLDCDSCKYVLSGSCKTVLIADCLLANGVILPPCKVGDVVYDVCTIFDESTLKPKTIIKPRIIDFVSKVGFIIESKGLVISEKEFGNTMFLTREEAEERLKKINEMSHIQK